MSLTVGPTGRVHSFEPVGFFNGVLKENAHSNQLANVIIYHAAAGAVLGEVEIKQNGQKEVVPMITIDSLKLEALDLIKIDVDGGDYQVLLGARSTIRRHHPLLIIEMESHQQEIYNLVCSLGYPYLIGMDGEPVTPGLWPANLIAAREPVTIPPRGSLSHPG